MDELATKERDEGITRLRKLFANKVEIVEQIDEVSKEVKEMISTKIALKKFDGKKVLGRFYQKIVSDNDIGMSFDVFCYSIAEKIGSKDKTPDSIKRTLASIRERLNSFVTYEQS